MGAADSRLCSASIAGPSSGSDPLAFHASIGPAPPPPSGNNFLRALYVTGEAGEALPLDPPFSHEWMVYKLTVLHTTTEVKVTPFASDPKATVITKQDGATLEVTRDEILYARLFPPKPPKHVVPAAGGGRGDGLEPEQAEQEPEPQAHAPGEDVEPGSPAHDDDDVGEGNDPGAGAGAGAGADKESEAPPPPPPVMESFEAVDLTVGVNTIELIVYAEDSTQRLYTVEVMRKEWEPDDWKPGTEMDEFLWLQYGADEGHPLAQMLLAQAFQDGKGFFKKAADQWASVPDHHANLHAFKWLLHAAENGHREAQQEVARLFYEGKVKEEWFHPHAQEDEPLGEEPFTQKELEQQAAKWYHRAAEQGDEDSALRLAMMFANGIGVRQNFSNCLHWLKRAGDRAAEFFAETKAAAEKGDQKAAKRTALMCLEGVGTPMSFDEAIHFFIASGEARVLAKNRIREKLAGTMPLYKQLFDAYADDLGELDEINFEGFYRDTLMARGYSKAEADRVTLEPYQGTQKSTVLFKAYDRNKDRAITFDEFWTHAHTHTSIIPQTEKQLKACYAFFEAFNPERGHHRRKSSKGLVKVLSKRVLSTDYLLGIVEGDDGSVKFHVDYASAENADEEEDGGGGGGGEEEDDEYADVIVADKEKRPSRMPTDFREYVQDGDDEDDQGEDWQ